MVQLFLLLDIFTCDISCCCCGFLFFLSLSCWIFFINDCGHGLCTLFKPHELVSSMPTLSFNPADFVFCTREGEGAGRERERESGCMCVYKCECVKEKGGGGVLVIRPG